MIRFRVALVVAVAVVAWPAAAQERVAIGTQRLTDNGALFLAASQGYFKAEGIDLARDRSKRGGNTCRGCD